MTDLNTPPVVIRRSGALGFAILFFTGIPLLLTLVQAWSAPDWRLPNGHTFLSGPAFFVLGFLLGVLLLLRPGRLTLAPEGLQYESLLRLRRRSWRWQDVSPFGTARVGAGKARRTVIEFNGPEWEALPARWELPTAEVLDLLNQARTRWGGHARPPVEAGLSGRQIQDNAALPKKPTPLTASLIISCWLAALLLIAVGSLVDYLFGYKDSFWLECTYILLVVVGWLLLLFAAIASLSGDSTPGVQRPAPVSFPGRLWRVVRRLSYAAGFLVWLALMIGSLAVLEQWRNQRVAAILAAGPTATTVATVTQLRERSSRSGTMRSTLLAYQAGAVLVHQALPGIAQYTVGQQLRVKYAVAHPDMFIVVP